MPMSARKLGPTLPELIRVGQSHVEFHLSKSSGTATLFLLNYSPTTLKPLPSPTDDKLYCCLSPIISIPDLIKSCCAICHLLQIKQFHLSASSKRFVPVVSQPVFMLQDLTVFHEACLYAFLSSDSMRLGPSMGLCEKLMELRDWVATQGWDSLMLERALDRVRHKIVTRDVREKEGKGDDKLVQVKGNAVLV
jgi:hypothetical protein